MKKLLYILRHAKAEFADGLESDHARPLSARGLADAEAMGAHLRAMPNLPQQVLCSTARRTRETHAALALDTPVAFSERLYLATAGELLGFVNALPDSTSTALIIGHNPGLHELVALLTHHAKREEDTESLREKFPTCALALLSFTTPWPTLTPDSGTLESLHYPQRNKA